MRSFLLLALLFVLLALSVQVSHANESDELSEVFLESEAASEMAVDVDADAEMEVEADTESEVDAERTEQAVAAHAEFRVRKGCGPGDGIGEKLVPDFNMGPACDKHDVCYAACGKSKDHCDDAFLSDMQTGCSAKYKIRGNAFQKIMARLSLNVCQKQADLYHWAVSSMGDSPYANAQKACAKPKSAVKLTGRF